MGQLQEIEKKKAEVTLGQAAKLIEENGYSRSIKKTHKTGFLVDSLKELEEQADMILLGKRGENANFATEHLGSTMERVARAATKPCFVASRDFKPIKRALISYDDSESCRKAVQFVKSSPIFKGIEIHVVTVSPNEKEEDRLKRLQKRGIRIAGLYRIVELPDASRRNGHASSRIRERPGNRLAAHGSLWTQPYPTFDYRKLDYGNAPRVPSAVYSVSLGFRDRPQVVV